MLVNIVISALANVERKRLSTFTDSDRVVKVSANATQHLSSPDTFKHDVVR